MTQLPCTGTPEHFSLLHRRVSKAVLVPDNIRTNRMLLRPWQTKDATDLAPILASNYAHLGPWIPSRISTPAPIAELTVRLQRFAEDFTGAKEWRYAMVMLDDHTLLGEISVFPRSPDARVPYDQSDRVEIGYWLRKDWTGRGLVTEGVRAVIDALSLDPRYACIEIRCDENNKPSSAIPETLGFTLGNTIDGLQIWSKSIH